MSARNKKRDAAVRGGTDRHSRSLPSSPATDNADRAARRKSDAARTSSTKPSSKSPLSKSPPSLNKPPPPAPPTTAPPPPSSSSSHYESDFAKYCAEPSPGQLPPPDDTGNKGRRLPWSRDRPAKLSAEECGYHHSKSSRKRFDAEFAAVAGVDREAELVAEYHCRCVSARRAYEGSLFITKAQLCFAGAPVESGQVRVVVERQHLRAVIDLDSIFSMRLGEAKESLFVYTKDRMIHSFYRVRHLQHCHTVIDRMWAKRQQLQQPAPPPAAPAVPPPLSAPKSPPPRQRASFNDAISMSQSTREAPRDRRASAAVVPPRTHSLAMSGPAAPVRVVREAAPTPPSSQRHTPPAGSPPGAANTLAELRARLATQQRVSMRSLPAPSQSTTTTDGPSHIHTLYADTSPSASRSPTAAGRASPLPRALSWISGVGSEQSGSETECDADETGVALVDERQVQRLALASSGRQRTKDPLFFSGESTRSETRRALVESMISAEQQYVVSLQELVDGYGGAVQHASDAIGAHEFAAIFCNLPVLLRHHRALLERLVDAVGGDLHDAFGAFMAAHFTAHTLPLYLTYAYNLPFAKTAYFQAVSQHAPVAAAITRCYEKSGRELAQLMLEPVQRLFHYYTSISRVMRYTLRKDAQYAMLAECRRKLHFVLDAISDFHADYGVFPDGFLERAAEAAGK